MYVVAVSFSKAAYRNNENDGPVQIGLVLSNPPLTDIAVQVLSNNRSATGEQFMHNKKWSKTTFVLGGGVDYNSGPYNVTFSAGTTEVYTDIVLVNDDTYENEEIFDLIIDPSSLPSNITVYNFGQATVTILNDDCK